MSKKISREKLQEIVRKHLTELLSEKSVTVRSPIKGGKPIRVPLNKKTTVKPAGGKITFHRGSQNVPLKDREKAGKTEDGRQIYFQPSSQRNVVTAKGSTKGGSKGRSRRRRSKRAAAPTGGKAYTADLSGLASANLGVNLKRPDFKSLSMADLSGKKKKPVTGPALTGVGGKPPGTPSGIAPATYGGKAATPGQTKAMAKGAPKTPTQTPAAPTVDTTGDTDKLSDADWKLMGMGGGKKKIAKARALSDKDLAAKTPAAPVKPVTPAAPKKRDDKVYYESKNKLFTTNNKKGNSTMKISREKIKQLIEENLSLNKNESEGQESFSIPRGKLEEIIREHLLKERFGTGSADFKAKKKREAEAAKKAAEAKKVAKVKAQLKVAGIPRSLVKFDKYKDTGKVKHVVNFSKLTKGQSSRLKNILGDKTFRTARGAAKAAGWDGKPRLTASQKVAAKAKAAADAKAAAVPGEAKADKSITDTSDPRHPDFERKVIKAPADNEPVMTTATGQVADASGNVVGDTTSATPDQVQSAADKAAGTPSKGKKGKTKRRFKRSGPRKGRFLKGFKKPEGFKDFKTFYANAKETLGADKAKAMLATSRTKSGEDYKWGKKHQSTWDAMQKAKTAQGVEKTTQNLKKLAPPTKGPINTQARLDRLVKAGPPTESDAEKTRNDAIDAALGKTGGNLKKATAMVDAAQVKAPPAPAPAKTAPAPAKTAAAPAPAPAAAAPSDIDTEIANLETPDLKLQNPMNESKFQETFSRWKKIINHK